MLTHLCIAEDALENVELADDERTKKNNELKIKRRDYTGYDDDEFVAGNEGMKRSLLSKYDEFLEGPKETVSQAKHPICVTYCVSQDFRLGGSSNSSKVARQDKEAAATSVNKTLLSIDYESEISFLIHLKFPLTPYIYREHRDDRLYQRRRHRIQEAQGSCSLTLSSSEY